VLESLESVVGLDYPSDRYELIVVDNGSTDGSFEKVKDFLESRSSLRKRVIRLGRNLGFTGGNNIGFTARDKESKYVLLLNNDAIIFQGGLKTLVEYAENHSDVAGLQGVILKYGTRFIDTAGDYLDEVLQTYALGQYHEYPWILRKPIYITYANGSCALYKIESVLKCLSSNKLFIDEFFGYGDDNVLGLMMWNRGYRIITVPEIIASHARSFTFGKYKRGVLQAYLSTRNRVALLLLTNNRYKHVVEYVMFSQILRDYIASVLKPKFSSFAQVRIRAFIDGIKLGERLKRKKVFIDMYKAPLIQISLKDIKIALAAKRVIAKYFEDWIAKNLSFLTVE
jgi:GT2 family glycosyltransferase